MPTLNSRQFDDGHEHQYAKDDIGIKSCKHCGLLPPVKLRASAEPKYDPMKRSRRVTGEHPHDAHLREIDNERRRDRYRRSGK